MTASVSRPSLLLVTGPGRSGAGVLAGLAGRLGYHVPTPLAGEHESRPGAFGTPRWSLDFHERLLNKLNVTSDDARPRAWDITAKAVNRVAARDELEAWLATQFGHGNRVIVKDPRLSWFLGLYREVADSLDARVSVVTLVRHPAESWHSRELGGDAATWMAGWLNLILGTEHVTRGLPRSLVRYEDLLDDWQTTLGRVEKETGAPLLSAATLAEVADAAEIAAPALPQARRDWAPLALPAHLQDLSARTYEAIGSLADGLGDLDFIEALREEYAAAYHTAEAISRSSRRAARLDERRRVTGRLARQRPHESGVVDKVKNKLKRGSR